MDNDRLFSINKVQIVPYIMLMIQNKQCNERIYFGVKSCIDHRKCNRRKLEKGLRDNLQDAK